MPAAGTPGIYQPLQYSSSTASPLPPPPSSSSSSAVYPPQYMHPASSQPAAPPFSSPPPLSSGVSFQHGGPGSPAAYLPPPVARAPGTQNEPASQRTGLHQHQIEDIQAVTDENHQVFHIYYRHTTGQKPFLLPKQQTVKTVIL